MRNPIYFTFSDNNFLPRTLAMLKSFINYEVSPKIIFVQIETLELKSVQILNDMNVEIMSIESIIDISTLNKIESNRTKMEFMWTLPSLLLNQFLQTIPGYTDVVYLDADLFFFNSSEKIWSEVPNGNISIIEHKMSQRLQREFPISGRFNVSWVSIPNNKLGLDCAKTWASQCVELCPEIPIKIKGKIVYGDQKYLDDWPSLYGDKLTVIENIGAGVAPWNFENYSFTYDDTFKVSGVDLIFYHFSSHQFGFLLARKMGRIYRGKSNIPKKLYLEYEQELIQMAKLLKLKKWRSRYLPFQSRVINFVKRYFSESKIN